jgi:hypothetical protein
MTTLSEQSFLPPFAQPDKLKGLAPGVRDKPLGVYERIRMAEVL